MKRTIAVFMALVAAAAGADDWTSGDKRAHFVGGAVISTAVTQYTNSAGSGFIAGCGVGIAGELVDAANAGTFHSKHVSFKDAASACLGAYVGAQTSLWISPNRIVWHVSF